MNEHESAATGHGRTSGVNDEVLVEVLAANGSQVVAGQVGQCSTRTVQRRLKDPAFVEAVLLRRRQRAAELDDLLMTSTHRALGVLSDALESEVVRERVLAAQAVLRFSLRFQTDQFVEDEFDARISLLEGSRSSNGQSQ